MRALARRLSSAVSTGAYATHGFRRWLYSLRGMVIVRRKSSGSAEIYPRFAIPRLVPMTAQKELWVG
jgi:hypothetical protein